MKRTFIYFAFIGFAGLMTACKGESKTEEVVEETPELEICYYTYAHETSVMGWTAYKTTAKAPVAGSFNEIEVSDMGKSDDPVKLIESLKFSMNTASVETNDESRNLKVATNFFGKMMETAQITGKVKSLNEDGTAVIEVMMNGVNVDVEGDYTLEDGKFDFKATIDIASWNALDALASLNEVCKDLHTGDDGVSKTWQEVAISFSTQLSSDCN